jgi:hypothetical protein
VFRWSVLEKRVTKGYECVCVHTVRAMIAGFTIPYYRQSSLTSLCGSFGSQSSVCGLLGIAVPRKAVLQFEGRRV